MIGATLGATAIFLAARAGLGGLAQRAGRFVGKLEAGFRADAFNYLLVLRLVPIFPFWLVNLVPALVGVRLPTYVLATFLGIIPGTFVFASLGNGLGSLVEEPDLAILFKPSVLLPIIGLALLALVPVGYKHWREQKGRHDRARSPPTCASSAPVRRVWRSPPARLRWVPRSCWSSAA